MTKATTSHGTYYLIDEDNYRAKRFPAPDRGELLTDNDWFNFSSWSGAAVGEIMHFNVIGHRAYDWQRTTRVASIEKVDEDLT